ncbi:MAG: ATP-binding protein [Atopobiaceae bacterium]|jgi:serine/threonine-protein kinase RsbW
MADQSQQRKVSITLPAEAQFARTVRMMAANLAVVQEMNVDDVEDVRMAAEECFVCACATNPDQCDVSFNLSADEISMDFSLGEGSDETSELDESLDLAELLLQAVCDSFEVSPDGKTLHVVKRMEASHDR